MKQASVTLYTTAGCHLCEQAEEILRTELTGFELQLIDIATSENLVSRYGLRIPVIALQDNTAELDWPFDAPRIADFLASHLP